MAKILVIDDQPINRQFLTTLLGYHKHSLLEAADGAEGLAAVRKARPDLVIADILMPTMDGYEFVRQMRADPELARTPVIFYTATYHEQSAHALAESCGVTNVITKPSEPEVILKIVGAALAAAPAPSPAFSYQEFDREHLRLVTDKLTEKARELEATNCRLAGLLESSRLLASVRTPGQLLENFCQAAREILGGRYAAVALLDEGGRSLSHFLLSGVNPRMASRIGRPSLDEGLLAQLRAIRVPLRLRHIEADPLAAGLPAAHGLTRSFLGVLVATPSQLYGLAYFLEKLGAEEFSREDEEVAVTLAGQAAVAYENLKRYEEIQRHSIDLEQRVAERTAELAAVNRELEAFTYSVSHDLRAPLRHIDGFSRILLEEHGASMDPKARDYLERVASAARRMGRLVDDLLKLSRVGRREVTQRRTELDQLLSDALGQVKADLAGRSVEWKIGSLPVVECDPGLIELVFTNLLANALKFSRNQQPAVIEVGVVARGDEQAIFVRDNGVGFDMKYAGKLFGVFQRLHRQEDFEGTGVGLATVQRIIHKHGGRIWAESKPDQGATFYFTLGALTSQPVANPPSLGDRACPPTP